jgi:hypothetical protein
VKHPYKLFFPFSILIALYACTLWLLYSFYGHIDYPGTLHAELFIGGFLNLNILGMLLTSTPLFTQTQPMGKTEFKISFLLIIGVVASVVIQNTTLYWYFIASGWVFLFTFVTRRFRRRKMNPPRPFLFNALGIVLGFAGSLLLAIGESKLGKILFYDGMGLSFILAFGGRLVPGMLGFKNTTPKKQALTPYIQTLSLGVYLGATLLVLSLFIEIYLNTRIAYTLRAIVITYMALRYWVIHKWPIGQGWYGVYLMIASWMVLAASWLLIFFREYQIHFKHLIYIGGLVLMTLLMASRMVLFTTEGKLEGESKHYPYSYIGVLVLLAALTRATVFLVPASYLNHLGYTALCIAIALIIWIIFFIPKFRKYR